MVSINIRAHIGADGVLRLDIPTGLFETEVEGRLEMMPVVDASSHQEPNAAVWPDGFFEATAGCWQGALERGDQGEFDYRAWQERSGFRTQTFASIISEVRTNVFSPSFDP